MNKLSGLVAVSLVVGLCAPFAANADDIVTLSYQSAPLIGSYSSLPTGLSNTAALPTSSFTGTITGSLVFDETTNPPTQSIVPISDSFQLMGSGGTDIGFFSGPAPLLVSYNNLSCANGSNVICVTTADGAITGATVGLVDSAYRGTPSQLSIGPQGDMASYLYSTTLQGTCGNIASEGPPGATYTGSTISPCSVQAASSTPGTWTVTTTSAPEIDPGTAASALTLLAGFAALVRGRRRATAGP
jgi:hypothetical protein